MKQPILAFFILLIIAVGGWYYYMNVYTQHTTSTDAGQTETPEVTIQAQPAPIAPIVPGPQRFNWVFTESVYDQQLSKPSTLVSLKVPCTATTCTEPETVIPVGTFDGLCSVVAQPESPNELTAALCWFAGAGDEIGVFDERGHMVIKKGVLEEPTAESPGFRGNFVDVATLPE
jgi:hypothetical protein